MSYMSSELYIISFHHVIELMIKETIKHTHLKKRQKGILVNTRITFKQTNSLTSLQSSKLVFKVVN